MNDSLSKLLELARGSRTELQECFFFIIGRHGSGKSAFISSFDQNIADLQTRSTFGYEYTQINHESKYLIHIYEFNDSSYNNLLQKLIKENIDKSIVIFTFDITHPNHIANQVSNLVAPLFESLSSEFGESQRQNDMEKYYSTICSNEPIAHSPSTMTKKTFLPTVFVATYDDKIEEFSDPKFDGFLHYMREEAIPYGAAITMAHAPSALQICLSLARREQFPEAIWDKICERDDFFIPPAWDSIEKVKAVEKEPVEDIFEEKDQKSEVKVQDFNAFIGDLSKVGHKYQSSMREKFMSPDKRSSAVHENYLGQFETE